MTTTVAHLKYAIAAIEFRDAVDAALRSSGVPTDEEQLEVGMLACVARLVDERKEFARVLGVARPGHAGMTFADVMRRPIASITRSLLERVEAGMDKLAEVRAEAAKFADQRNDYQARLVTVTAERDALAAGADALLRRDLDHARGETERVTLLMWEYHAERNRAIAERDELRQAVVVAQEAERVATSALAQVRVECEAVPRKSHDDLVRALRETLDAADLPREDVGDAYIAHHVELLADRWRSQMRTIEQLQREVARERELFREALDAARKAETERDELRAKFARMRTTWPAVREAHAKARATIANLLGMRLAPDLVELCAECGDAYDVDASYRAGAPRCLDCERLDTIEKASGT